MKSDGRQPDGEERRAEDDRKSAAEQAGTGQD